MQVVADISDFEIEINDYVYNEQRATRAQESERRKTLKKERGDNRKVVRAIVGTLMKRSRLIYSFQTFLASYAVCMDIDCTAAPTLECAPSKQLTCTSDVCWCFGRVKMVELHVDNSTSRVEGC